MPRPTPTPPFPTPYRMIARRLPCFRRQRGLLRTPPPGSRGRRLWRTRGVTMGLVAVLVGGVGEALLFQEAWRGWGGALLAGAALLAALAWSDTRDGALLAARPRLRGG